MISKTIVSPRFIIFQDVIKIDLHTNAEYFEKFPVLTVFYKTENMYVDYQLFIL